MAGVGFYPSLIVVMAVIFGLITFFYSCCCAKCNGRGAKEKVDKVTKRGPLVVLLIFLCLFAGSSIVGGMSVQEGLSLAVGYFDELVDEFDELASSGSELNSAAQDIQQQVRDTDSYHLPLPLAHTPLSSMNTPHLVRQRAPSPMKSPSTRLRLPSSRQMLTRSLSSLTVLTSRFRSTPFTPRSLSGCP